MIAHKTLTAIVLLLIPQLVIADEWRVSTRIDSVTDEKVTMAATINSTGDGLVVFEKNGTAFLMYSTPKGVVLGQRFPMVRIDSNPHTDYERMRSLQETIKIPMVSQSATSVSMRIHAGGPADRGALRELMDGKTLLIRVFTFPENLSRDVTFDLVGAKAAIAATLGIPENINPERLALLEKAERARAEAMKTCDPLKQDPKRYYICQKEILSKFPNP